MCMAPPPITIALIVAAPHPTGAAKKQKLTNEVAMCSTYNSLVSKMS